MPGDADSVTVLLAAASAGDQSAAEKVFPIIYEELRRIAARHLGGETHEPSLQPTALVNEAYLRLMGGATGWESRKHFFAVASRVMRNVLVDRARNRLTAKRGSGVNPIPIDPIDSIDPAGKSQDFEVLAVDQALSRLLELNERQGKIVEMVFFGGLTESEVGETLGISTRTVRRDWITARAWLHAQLKR